MITRDRIIEAAANLLDSGGESAVTLRAVGQASGVSHNAPYKHFDDRNSLLAALACRDMQTLTEAFLKAGSSRAKPMSKLTHALEAFIAYGRDYPARYRLLFSDPRIAAEGGALEAAAMAAFTAFAAVVEECQRTNCLPQIPALQLSGLLYASVHGLIDLQVGGRMRTEKGFKGVSEAMTLLLKLLSRSAREA